MANLVMGYWDCPFCGSKGIAGTTVNCPSCGRARGDVKFYMKNVAEGEIREQHERNDIDYLNEEQAKYVSENPDWYCSFCNSLNSDNAQFCGNCGASRSDSEHNYFDRLQKMKEREQAEAAAQAASSSQPAPKKRNPLFFIAIAAVLIIGLVMFLNGKKTSGDLKVTGLEWTRTVSIEKNIQYSESGWELPSGAELTEKKKEIHHYDNVIDRYVKKNVQRVREVLDHYESYYTYKDNGNGTFTEVENQRPVYRTENYTETVSEPVYKQVPKYSTKYYYTIWRWTPDHELTASGTDHNTAWPETELAEDEREGTRAEEYRFTVEDGKKKTTTTYRLAEADWMNLNVDDMIYITAKRTGSGAYISDEKGNKIADVEKVR
jgi:hypothetical protein